MSSKQRSAPKGKTQVSAEQPLSESVDQLTSMVDECLSNTADDSFNMESAISDIYDFAESLKQIVDAREEPAIRAVVDSIIVSMQTLLRQGISSSLVVSLDELSHQIETLKQIIDIHLESDQPTQAPVPKSKVNQLLVGIQDPQLVDEIATQVKYFNYECIICESFDDIEKKINSNPADTFSALLLDVDYCPEKDPTAVQPIADSVPLLFISYDESMESRLFAAKAGGLAYLVRPVEFTSLIEKIDTVALHQKQNIPYRVLIIEDSNTQAKFISQQLINAGMSTKVLSEPMKINDVLQEFQPELILMDLYMPKCSGFELTCVIRQQDPYTSIPIVYLSAEEDRDKQLHAITIGGDDFLTKPIDPNHLVSAVKARAERGRILRAEMIQDSLTGLLNHTRILEQLDLEIARAKRNDIPLTFAMIDIDFFKTINDNHGHPVGDRVIKGLARLLKQRLRKTDSIGRYGGEEFAVILPQTDLETMLPLLDSIRKGFSRLLHQSGDPLVEFTATISVGVAELNDENNTVGNLVQAADRALYQAKSNGRNRIEH